jgi:hypothetical protein
LCDYRGGKLRLPEILGESRRWRWQCCIVTQQTEYHRLCREIEQCEARFATLAQEQAQLLDQLVALRKALLALDRNFDPVAASTSSGRRGPETATEKIALFRSLFRGREDV